MLRIWNDTNLISKLVNIFRTTLILSLSIYLKHHHVPVTLKKSGFLVTIRNKSRQLKSIKVGAAWLACRMVFDFSSSCQSKKVFWEMKWLAVACCLVLTNLMFLSPAASNSFSVLSSIGEGEWKIVCTKKDISFSFFYKTANLANVSMFVNMKTLSWCLELRIQTTQNVWRFFVQMISQSLCIPVYMKRIQHAPTVTTTTNRFPTVRNKIDDN